MTACNYASDETPTPVRKRSSWKANPQAVIGNAALACIALACAWTLYANLAGPSVAPPMTAQITPAAPAAPERDVALLDRSMFRGYPAEVFAQAPLGKSDRLAIYASVKPDALQISEAPPQDEVEQAEAPAPQDVSPEQPPAVQLAETVPLPAPRPAVLAAKTNDGPSRREVAQASKAMALPVTAPEKPPSIFEKLFGKLQRPGPMLAYAAPDGGITSDGQSTGRYDRQTAVYDISARTVYMPDGTKLEAHSGYGDKIDNPRFVHVRMRGATPPHVYDLTMRESLFHGVQAIRLNPVGGNSNVYGRTGLLAHTYMLGPNGASNGCVSFKDYDAFLRAFKNNEVKRLVVVARL